MVKGEADLWTGACEGGPMDGQEGQSRFPDGFLLIHKQARRVWLYDFKDGSFYVRSEEGEELIDDPEAVKNRWRAAEEFHYDVRSWGGEDVN